MFARQISDPGPLPTHLNPLPSGDCTLFTASKKLNPHRISNLQALFKNTPGYGYPIGGGILGGAVGSSGCIAMSRGLFHPVHRDAAQQFRIEIGGFLRQHFAGCSDVHHLLHIASV